MDSVQLPYEPRPGQILLADAVAKMQHDGGQLLAEAATGTGKTVAVLAAALQNRLIDGRTIVWATRTNSQQAQVVREHHALDPDGRHLLIPFMGRRHYCPLLREDERFKDGTSEELGRLCRDAKRKAVQARDTGMEIDGACPYYARLLADGSGPAEALLRTDPSAFAAAMEKTGACPYEALKVLLPRAGVVVVPFIFLIDDRLRSTFMQWLGVGPDACHVVFDEAHNLPAAVRDHASPRLSQASLMRAQQEAIEWKDPVLAGTTLTTTIVDRLVRILHDAVAEHVRNGEDGLLPPGAIEEDLMTALRVPSTQLRRIAADLDTLGEAIREDRRAKGKLPRSYLGSVGAFLQMWLAQDDRISIVTAGDNPAIERFLVDPARVLGWLETFWSTTHISGTLAPLDEHARVLGVEGAQLLRLPDPYGGQITMSCIEGIHRRFEDVRQDPALTMRQQQAAMALLEAIPGRIALWFPSHNMVEEYIEEGFLHDVSRKLFVERKGMPQAQLLQLVQSFRKTPGALLLGVLGGRLTEGIDYPGALDAILIFGVPYPRPTARGQALIHHYDRQGNGWSVAVHTPVGRVLRQAVGRLVRGPGDRGVAVILDERAVRFQDHLPGITLVTTTGEALIPVEEGGFVTADTWNEATGPKGGHVTK